MLVKIISVMLRNTYTTDDLIERLGLMRDYYGKRVFTKGDVGTIDDILGARTEQATLDALHEWEQAFEEGNIQPVVVYEALDTVQEEVSSMPSVILYVPVRLGPEDVIKIGTWFRGNVQPNMLFTMRVDPRATGGCGLIWNDTYYDFSLHYYIEKHRDELVERLDSEVQHA
jgi:hypothetical protein